MPERPYGPGGWRPCRQFRLVPGWWFFGARLEELWERRDGRREWRKAERAIDVKTAA